MQDDQPKDSGHQWGMPLHQPHHHQPHPEPDFPPAAPQMPPVHPPNDGPAPLPEPQPSYHNPYVAQPEPPRPTPEPMYTPQPPQPPVTPAVPVTPPAVPPAVPQTPPAAASMSDQPAPVIQVLSVRGVEYAMMTLLLWFGAGSLLILLLMLFNGATEFLAMAFPLAFLLVCVPGFVFFFRRLKQAELDNPALRFDPSKRRLSQFTQIITFALCLFSVVGLLFIILQAIGGEGGVSVWKAFLNVLTTLVIAGGILVYYWIDEHRVRR